MTEPAPKVRGRAGIAALACAIAMPCEGLRQWAYRDTGGIWTTCWGDTHQVDPTHHYSIEECRGRLTAEMLIAVDQVETCVPGAPPEVEAAFADAVYNLGPTIACDRRPAPKGSTAARLLYAHQWRGACEQLPAWNKSRVAGVLVPLPGLTSRRALERDLCLKGAP